MRKMRGGQKRTDPERAEERKGKAMRTQILAEDGQLLVCLKPAGLAVQSARPGEADMVSELKNYLAASEKGKKGAGGRRAPYLGVVHRLDQPVSGILVFAKTPEAAAALSRQASGMQDVPEKGTGGGKKRVSPKQMEKEYRALVYVSERALLPEEEKERELTDFLKKEPGQNLSRVVAPETPGAKRARLFCHAAGPAVHTSSGGHACLAVRLDTGRHHQIRVQLSHAGLPILGDTRYGSAESLEYAARLGIRSLCLCACRLCFFHPVTGKRMEFEIASYPWEAALKQEHPGE